MQFPSNPRVPRWFLTAVYLIVALPGFVSGRTPAAGSCIHFDVPQLVCCRPVCASHLPPDQGEQLVEAVFDVSTLLQFGQERQVRQLLFVIESPAGTLRVADFAPRTELTSLYVGHIEQSRQQEESSNLGLSAAFSPSEFLSAQGNSSQGSKSNDTIRFQTLPPMQLLAASGTVARGTAVYFKFKATPQTTLDGSRPLRVMFRVPAGWRGDYVYLRCVAYADTSTDGRSAVCGSADFLVPLYLDGDEAARDAARRLAEIESELRQLARHWKPRLARSQKASFSDKLTAIFRDEKTTTVPELWLSTVLTSGPTRRDFSFQTRLPEELSRAVKDFTDARWQLAQLNP
jgi:hypothetical protein